MSATSEGAWTFSVHTDVSFLDKNFVRQMEANFLVRYMVSEEQCTEGTEFLSQRSYCFG